MRTRTAAGSLAAMTAASVLVAPGAAFASTAHRPLIGSGAGSVTRPVDRLAAVKARAEVTIDLRLRVLRGDATLVTRAKHLSDADRSALAAVIGQDITGLTALRAKIAADTDTATVRTDAATVYTGYRVFLLLEPQLRTVISADSIVAGAQTVTSAASALSTSLTSAGTLTADETALLATVTSDAAAATTAVNGEVSAILALTPSMVTKTLRPAVLTTARTDDRTARVQLRQARAALAAAKKLSSPASTSS